MKNEWYTDLKTSKSNQNSKIKNDNLLVALSNKTVYLHDIRLLTEPILSWNMPSTIKDPQCCQFFLDTLLNDHIHDEDIINIPHYSTDDDNHLNTSSSISLKNSDTEALKHLKGHIIVGDLINGDFIQVYTIIFL